MDMRTKDKDGLTVCPQCGKHFSPVLGERKNPSINIQDEFPKAKSWEREQLLTGICSDECWNEYLGIVEDAEDGEEF